VLSRSCPEGPEAGGRHSVNVDEKYEPVPCEEPAQGPVPTRIHSEGVSAATLTAMGSSNSCEPRVATDRPASLGSSGVTGTVLGRKGTFLLQDSGMVERDHPIGVEPSAARQCVTEPCMIPCRQDGPSYRGGHGDREGHRNRLGRAAAQPSDHRLLARREITHRAAKHL
jgi:hypothetical protein